MATTLRESPNAFAQLVLGVTPHPTQAQFLESRAPVKTACCGRRWGKSFIEAIDLIWFAVARAETTQFLFAPTADQSRIIMEYAESLLNGCDLQDYVETSSSGRVLKESPFPEIRFKNGSSIHARTAGKTGVPARGRGADRVILDEAAYIPESIIDAVIQPYLANSEYAERVNLSTPFGLNHFYEDYQRGENGVQGYESFRFPSSTSPYVTREYLEQERLQKTDMQFRVEYLAEFVEDQNAVFPYSLIQSCIDPDLISEPIPGHRYCVGWDPAKWTDRSGVVLLDITDALWRVIEVLDIAGQDYLEHQWPKVKHLANAFNNASILMDSTNNEAILEYAQKDIGARGRVTGFAFTNPSKQELINGLVLAMEQNKLRFPPHPLLIEELRYYRYELTAAGNVKLGADEKHHDDLVTALALAVQAAGSPRAFREEDVQAALNDDLKAEEWLFA